MIKRERRAHLRERKRIFEMKQEGIGDETRKPPEREGGQRSPR